MSHVPGPRIGEHATGLAVVSRRLGWGVRVVVSVGPGVSVHLRRHLAIAHSPELPSVGVGSLSWGEPAPGLA